MYKEYISGLRLNLDDKSLLIDQGGADVSAKAGLEVLASELREQLKDEKFSKLKAIATPSGTGTTALYLSTLFT
ncbi:MAG: hypothetical protein Q9M40_04920 [Sulfurimonas sp.]|nr:hypothetical protein [Sulfurimonas sp.]